MDNISHSLISIAVAATVSRKSSHRVRKAALWTAFIAGNLPDIDIVTTIMGNHAKLVYLLHHRGHTHTILYVLLTGLLIGWAATWFLKKRDPNIEQGTTKTLLITAVSCSALHLFMDWWNNYGVHPFYPFDNKWYYGDAIFIVEPIIWVSLAPLCFFLSKLKRYRLLTLLLPTGAIFLASILELSVTAVTISLIFAATFIWEWKKPRHHPSLMICAASLLAFFVGAQFAKRSGSSKPAVPNGAILLDTAVSPAPANPFCWKFYTMSLDGKDYVVRTGVASLLPNFVMPSNCFINRGSEKTVSFSAVEGSTDDVWLEGEYRIARENFTRALSNCEFRALMIFARIPFIVKDETEETVFGDLRFDNEKGLSFSEFSLNRDADCVGLRIPPWVPPRQDIFE